jgi:site-specific DNA recombinase
MAANPQSLYPDARKPIGIWLRVSTEDQVRGESLEVHEHRARSYAESKGWEVREVYRLEAVSGKRVSDHKEAKRMIVDVESGHIEALIFSKLARLSRNNRELLEFADLFKRANADLVSLAESIDTSSPAGRMFYNMLASMANWEREEIAARVAASVPIRAKMGKLLGGQAPYGYQRVDQKLIVDPVEAPIRVLMYNLFKEYRRKKVVARMLNELGHRTRNGSKFSDTTVDRLLRDPTAKGLKRVNYTKQRGDGKGAWELKPESDWVYQPVEAIVSEELWSEVVAVLDEKKVRGARQTKSVVHLFAGYTFCECGTKMSVLSGTKKYCCTNCKNKIPIDTLNGIFISELKGYVFNPAEIEAHKRDAIEKLASFMAQIEGNREAVKKADKEIDKLIALHGEKLLDQVGFKKRYEPLREQIIALDEELPKLQAKHDVLAIALTSEEEVMYQASQGLAERFETMEHKEQRGIVETIVNKITVGSDEVEITFLFEPNSMPSPHTPLGTDNKRATRYQGFMAATS